MICLFLSKQNGVKVNKYFSGVNSLQLNQITAHAHSHQFDVDSLREMAIVLRDEA